MVNIRTYLSIFEIKRLRSFSKADFYFEPKTEILDIVKKVKYIR